METAETSKSKVARVEPYGVFLENGGFIHLTSIAKKLGKRIDEKELRELFPPGTEVSVKILEIVKDTQDRVTQIHYSLENTKE